MGLRKTKSYTLCLDQESWQEKKEKKTVLVKTVLVNMCDLGELT